MMGQVLGTVAQKTGSAAPLTPLWVLAVGPLTARHARPLRLSAQGELHVHVDAVQWRDALLRHEPDIVEKLAAQLGVGVVRSLKIEVG